MELWGFKKVNPIKYWWCRLTLRWVGWVNFILSNFYINNNNCISLSLGGWGCVGVPYKISKLVQTLRPLWIFPCKEVFECPGCVWFGSVSIVTCINLCISGLVSVSLHDIILHEPLPHFCWFNHSHTARMLGTLRTRFWHNHNIFTTFCRPLSYREGQPTSQNYIKPALAGLFPLPQCTCR